MSKAMLIMDMPKTCIECCLCDEYGYCGVECKLCESRFTKVQKWCPLREVPQKKEIFFREYEITRIEKQGYNACIDEILGGGE